MITFTWVAGIISVLGIAGTIAAVILIPAVAIPILQNTVTWLLKCKPCLYAIVIVALCSASWWHGHHTAVLKCREGELAAKLAAQKADLDHAKQSAADEAEKASRIEADANDQKQKDAAYIESLQKRLVPACLLDDADLGGVPDRQPGPAGAKPAAHPK